MSRSLLTLSLAAVVLAVPATAPATKRVFSDGTAVYDNRAEFLADLGLRDGVTEDFEDATLVEGLTIRNGTVADGVLTASPRYDQNVLGIGLAAVRPGAIAFDYVEADPRAESGIVFNLYSRIRGEDGYYDDYAGARLPQPGVGFFGAISKGVFTGATFNARVGFGARTITIDNLQLFDALPVPEPATWTLMIAGFGLVGVSLRRRRSTTVVA